MDNNLTNKINQILIKTINEHRDEIFAAVSEKVNSMSEKEIETLVKAIIGRMVR